MTFWRAQERTRAAAGKLILRVEDLDAARCRPEFHDAIEEDLKWFGFVWDEGSDVGGPNAPYLQSQRRDLYFKAWEQLRAGGWIYACRCSRKDVLEAALAPHDENEEPLYPGTCRPAAHVSDVTTADSVESAVSAGTSEGMPPGRRPLQPAGLHWRFRVPDGEQVEFTDERLGLRSAIAGKDFGDFVVWRKDDVPAYQLAVVVDDDAMRISEVVRGEDLLTSTFRQLLIYRALNLQPPKFYHSPLLKDEHGRRLAKRHASLSLRELRRSGAKPEQIRERFAL